MPEFEGQELGDTDIEDLLLAYYALERQDEVEVDSYNDLCYTRYYDVEDDRYYGFSAEKVG